ncbi:hypothetical protein ACQKPB_22450, partial [Sphingomonas sp. NPDC085925]
MPVITISAPDSFGTGLIEIPITLVNFFGREVTTGGGFFRLLPGEV